jgi:hypothetical protein
MMSLEFLKLLTVKLAHIGYIFDYPHRLQNGLPLKSSYVFIGIIIRIDLNG